MKTSMIRMLVAAVALTAGAWAAAQFEPVQPAQPAPGSALPEVVASINGEPIPRENLLQALGATTRRLLSSPQAQQQGITQLSPEQQQQVLESIINNRIALRLAEEAGVDVSDEEVETFVQREIARFPSEEVFGNFLQSEGIDIDIMRQRTRELLRIQAYRDQVTADISVPEEEVRAQYEVLRDDGRLNAPKTWDFRHILVKADPNDPAAMSAAEAEARAVHARIAGGEEFAAVAQEMSDDLNSREGGGLYRNVPRGRGMFDEAFEEEALSVPAGGLSEPFSTRMGWHLVAMEAVHEAGLMSFERVSESLENQILSQRQQMAMQERLMAARNEMDVQVFVSFGAPGQQPGGSAIDDLLRQLDEGS